MHKCAFIRDNINDKTIEVVGQETFQIKLCIGMLTSPQIVLHLRELVPSKQALLQYIQFNKKDPGT